MNETNQHASLDDLWDSLTPYEVGVLAFTSPRIVDVELQTDISRITLTAKEAYIWAGALAHVVVRRPNLSVGRIAQMFERALTSAMERQVFGGEPYESAYRGAVGNVGIHEDVIAEFLRQARLPTEQELVASRTRDAVQSLIWRGHIEDPFSKKVGAAIIAVMMNLPISFTSPGPNEVHLQSLSWSYVQRAEGEHVQREFRVKTREVCDVVLHKIVPSVIEAVEKLSGSGAVSMPPKELQQKLADRGYYVGPIDGKIARHTQEALRRFQRDQYLRETGHPDPETIERLK